VPNASESNRSRDKVLFTPGPLTTSRAVKEAMLRDLGSRDFEFIETVRDIRRRLVAMTGRASELYEAILMQGSGTFSIEAVFASCVPPEGKVLVVVNGAYGRRMAAICERLRIACFPLEFAENELADPAKAERVLEDDPRIGFLAIVHCETTTGIINPIERIGRIAAHHRLTYFVDAMSSFGAIPIDLAACHIDYLVSSANKCIEGVPGFAFAIARRDSLLSTSGYARSLSLDLLAQWQGLEKDGQFRFTPPTHALLAFRQALLELEQEGGVEGRAARYRHNYQTLVDGMRALGFEEYLPRERQGYIITSFRYPNHPNFSFDHFYKTLNDKGFVIYPGKVSNADCFRIGNIGRISERDVRNLLAAIQDTLREMRIELAPCTG
jgi:2-aminoethylphosphonate-pyruvate transaminase